MKPVLSGLTAIALVGMLTGPSYAGRDTWTDLPDNNLNTRTITSDMCDPVINGTGNPVALTTGRVVRDGSTSPCIIQAAASTTTMERAVYINSDLTFGFDQSTVRPSYFPQLDRIAAELNANPGMTVKIAGYTDSTGSEAYNRSLSMHRAQAVRDYLLQNGVPTTAMTTEAFGETQPIASNATATGRAENRRVELAGATMVKPVAAASPLHSLSGPEVADGTIVGLDFGNRLVKLEGDRAFNVPDLAMMDELKTGNSVTVHYRIDDGRDVAFDILQRGHESQT
jgi:outer membrane protein OmpA-like peptidoglycan-associated protein